MRHTIDDNMNASNGNKEVDIGNENTKVKNLKWFNFKTEVVWFNVVLYAIWHAITVYWFLTFPYWQYKGLVLWALAVDYFNVLSTTAGVHRLWAHRSYKAKLPLRFLLAFGFYCSGLNSITQWTRDHRTHHKYSDTDADPHSIGRGFFFAHIGWKLTKKHPDVVRGGNGIDMSDVTSDPVVAFFDRHFVFFKTLCCFVLPVFVPVYFFNQELKAAIMTQWFMRYVCTAHKAACVNSFAHTFGCRPFNKSIGPSDNWTVAVLTAGEGWHNYHHTFPWDYKTSEHNSVFVSNHTTGWINLWAKLGLAYDLKEADPELVKKVKSNGTQ